MGTGAAGTQCGGNERGLSDLLTAGAGIDSPHHDYPAVDLMMSEGTPVFAVTGGTLIPLFREAFQKSGNPRHFAPRGTKQHSRCNFCAFACTTAPC